MKSGLLTLFYLHHINIKFKNKILNKNKAKVEVIQYLFFKELMPVLKKLQVDQNTTDIVYQIMSHNLNVYIYTYTHTQFFFKVNTVDV